MTDSSLEARLLTDACGARPQAVPRLDDDTARLVTFNVLTGGIDADGSEQRRIGQIEFLRTLDADVIALQELRGWEAGGWWRLWEVANALRMVPLPPVLSQRGRGNHLALLYRRGTVGVRDYEPDAVRGAFYHGLGRARLYIMDQPALTVLITHLSFLGGDERLAEARWLTGYADTYEGTAQRVALLGDLNTIGLNDPEPDWSRIPANLRSRHCHLTPHGTFGATDRRAIQLLSEAGWRDPFDLLSLEPHRTAGYWSPDELLDHRSDLILVNQHLTGHVAEAVVHDTDQTRKLSDHLPVEVRLSARPVIR
ncbi:endonuclease/exonuclease/phosphatase family protein [Streptomyces olivoreticuli]|uniref:endonuclease/exonuclease/phosphatase family protein n=1 Tax=Streptomyces olivoreticuli TaxID=68246 RepID=UPI000E246A48|nr:endonuclease/exonuclease/phosphatase family protein [Streptomyces olivoreticuli]